AYMTILKSVEAGADAIDTAVSCFSGGTSQPATETMVYALEQLGWETGIDTDALKLVNDHFKRIRAGHLESGLLDPISMATDSEALSYKIPGGMLSNLIAQLKAANAMHLYEDVLEETPRVREELGYPPLVTPMSQMVGVQAAANVLDGERYKTVSKEIRAYIRGEYGTPPGEIDPALVFKVLGEEKPITGRYAASLPPEFEHGKDEAGSLARSDEDVLSYILFPAIAEKFFKWREEHEAQRYAYRIVQL
ncbi:MAG: oxaloacetate decarboxylase subunit alpha, partial [Peptococcaceae bacterium]|nr:oxaloacetate decarboxylase subunit alpha [Peptococcaceae bacterium]